MLFDCAIINRSCKQSEFDQFDEIITSQTMLFIHSMCSSLCLIYGSDSLDAKHVAKKQTRNNTGELDVRSLYLVCSHHSPGFGVGINNTSLLKPTSALDSAGPRRKHNTGSQGGSYCFVTRKQSVMH